jgi:queuine tRNA-ribosyltransferase
MADEMLTLPHGPLPLPNFLPDATRGVVRSLDSLDLTACGVEAVVMNTFHLMQKPGSSTIQALGDLHQMAGWSRPIVTDSGGFQAYSLIRQNAKYGQITEKGITFRPDNGKRKLLLTPEKSIQLQLSYGTDIAICLDDCTHVDDPLPEQARAVERTIAWAKRCKQEFERIIEQKKLSAPERPRLFAVIQGGGSEALRRACAEALLAIGFDGYGYGGWPLDGQGQLLADIIAYTRNLIPAEFPMHALGVGHPGNIVACARLGYQLFDSAMPTRDARHGRLYVFSPDAESGQAWWSYLYAHDSKYIKAGGPVSPGCDCLCCANYSLGYLHHLFKINDSLFQRLATIHNVRFMMQLMKRLRRAGGNDL